MAEKRTLEDVLADLKEAEKEYNEKCLKYGITEKRKKKKDEENEPSIDQTEVQNDEIQEEIIENTSNNQEEISEN